MNAPFLDLYLPGRSWLHRLDPRAKLWMVGLAVLVGVLFHDITVLAGLLLSSHLALLTAGIPPAHLGRLWRRLAPLLTMILILQPLFSSGSGPALFRLGPVAVTAEGIWIGASFALRMAALAFTAAALLWTTESGTWVQGLVKLGLPYPWGLTVGLAIRYLPTTYGLFVSIQEAQQARGWIVGQGGLIRRARSYVPILVATIIAALRLSDQLGLALAARGLGYPARRTVRRDLCFSGADWLAVALATLAFGGLLLCA